MNKINCGFDLDCVLNNLTEVWTQELNKKYHLHVKYEDIKEWDMSKAFKTLTKKQIYKPLIKRKIWKHIRPTDGSQECLKLLKESGCKVYIITATHYKNVKWKVNWLKKYFPFMSWDDVIIVKDKSLINVDVLVDDYEANLINGTYKKLLFNQPWNENFNEKSNNIIRVHSFDDISKNILSMTKCKDETDFDCFKCEYVYDDHGYPCCSKNYAI